MEYNDQIKNRLKRIEGQLKGVIRMIEEEKECKDVITQLSASRSAIDRAIGLIVSTNLVRCMEDENELKGKDKETLIKEAVDLLVKSR
ncbi:metal-sensitive transcriptional regulator [Viridibacillus sp. FSL E2-0187]|jgi:DNA-binding FrmR family transcriptional regulator|uniref:Cytoplasmic protein n=1 Tax=Viridibacillus arvi TaxID=263475 RepID=A0A0M0LNM6_9BACL|nr:MULTISPECIES: metal-sensitive transcriptional regulator [Viridibacillus]KOO52477.1 cytoplasmic protein [Viridibacillus arvi]QOV13025.1 metal-sensitive transcriptional regulator [Viridibacillus sp. JNUCC-6]